MATANDHPPAPAHRHTWPGEAETGPAIGDRTPPNNAGALGFTYTIYRFYDAADRLLYLGESGRVRQRIVDLEIGNPRGLPLGFDDGPKPWWREAVRIELQHLPPGTTEAEAKAEEHHQIEMERPLYNRVAADGPAAVGTTADREAQERVLEQAHFESDVATVEHERHDGVVRDMTQIEIESRRAADRLRPGGSALLDALPRQARPEHGPAERPSQPGPPVADSAGEPEPKAVPQPAPAPIEHPPTGTAGATFYPVQRGGSGPGSRLGLAIVALVLVVTVVVALVVSLQAAF